MSTFCWAYNQEWDFGAIQIFFFFKVFRVDINNANVFWALLIQEEKQPTSDPPAPPVASSKGLLSQLSCELHRAVTNPQSTQGPARLWHTVDAQGPLSCWPTGNITSTLNTFPLTLVWLCSLAALEKFSLRALKTS